MRIEAARPAIVIIQVRDDVDLGQSGGTGGGEWSNSKYILKIGPKVLGIGCERKRRQDEAEVSALHD